MSIIDRYVDTLQSKGQYIFSTREVVESTKSSIEYIRLALSKSIAAERIVSISKALYLIIPLEYKNVGAPPVEWYIDKLMAYRNAEYYISLQSAASYHGASHQAIQVYQVMSNKRYRAQNIGRTKIKYYYNKHINMNFVEQLKTYTGYINIASPALLAIDLIKYMSQSGHINMVTTTLNEMMDKINIIKLIDYAKTDIAASYIQKVGYLLDFLGYKDNLSKLLQLASEKQMRFIPLISSKEYSKTSKDKKWKLYINETIETDL